MYKSKIVLPLHPVQPTRTLKNRIGILSRARAVRMRRYAIVLIVVVAAVLTPPDVVSQIVLALPMWGLFELSLLFMHDDKK